MIKHVEQLKKWAMIGVKVLGVIALILLVVFMAKGSSLRSGSIEEASQKLDLASPAYYDVRGGYASNPSQSPAPVSPSDPILYGSGETNRMADEKSAVGTNQLALNLPRKVVKAGSLHILVKKAEETADKIKMIATESVGFVDKVDIQDVSETSKSGIIIIRVPSDKFDEVLEKIKQFAIKVDKEEVGAIDITEEFVDLEARLKNLKAQEIQYLKILDRATKIEDILNVSSNLSYIRGEIERLQGRIRYLSVQVDMSSVTVYLTEEADVQLFGIRWRPLFVLKQGARDMLSGLSKYADSMIAFVFILPLLIVWLLTLGVGVWLVHKIYIWTKNRFFKK